MERQVEELVLAANSAWRRGLFKGFLMVFRIGKVRIFLLEKAHSTREASYSV